MLRGRDPDLIRTGIPTGRFGQPDDYAAIVEFLASDDAPFVTGQTLPVDGGTRAASGCPRYDWRPRTVSAVRSNSLCREMTKVCRKLSRPATALSTILFLRDRLIRIRRPSVSPEQVSHRIPTDPLLAEK